MEKYKKEYNALLKRYYNGIKYLEFHPNEIEKYIGEIKIIMEKLGNMIIAYNICGDNIILGFKEC